MEKLSKPRILGLGNEIYPLGRIDTFKIEITGRTEEQLMSLLIELGFSPRLVRQKLQSTLGEDEYVFLFGDKKIKVHLFVNVPKDFLDARFDTNVDRQEIVKKVGKYFNFPK